MTTVDLVLCLAEVPTETAAIALAEARDVYGIRRLQMDSAALTLTLEYDATRLNQAEVEGLVRRAGIRLAALASPLEQAAQEPVNTGV
jgi:hypothetical protein